MQQQLTTLLQALLSNPRLREIHLQLEYHQPIDKSHTAIWVTGFLVIAIIAGVVASALCARFAR